MERLILSVGDAFFQFSWTLLGESIQKYPQALWLALGADGAAPSQGSEGWTSSLLGHCSCFSEEAAGFLLQPSRDLAVGLQ